MPSAGGASSPGKNFAESCGLLMKTGKIVKLRAAQAYMRLRYVSGEVAFATFWIKVWRPAASYMQHSTEEHGVLQFVYIYIDR